MAKRYADAFWPDAVRIATTRGVTRPQLSSDLGGGQSTLSKRGQQHQHVDLMSGLHDHVEKKKSYAQKLVTVRLGGVLKLLDPVLELNPLNDFWQSICAAELPPFLLG